VTPVPILPDQIGAVSSLRRCSCAEPSGNLGEAFRFGPQCLRKNGPVLGLGGPPGPSSPLLQGLDETVIQAPDDKLTHNTLRDAIAD